MSFKPEALCLDEPLSALDQPTRHAICDTLQQIKEETQLTILHITHSLDEAQRLLDDLFLMSEGSLRESTESEKHSLVHLKDTSLAELFEPRLEPDSGLGSKNAQ
jgi:ABC-type multidrug transport system ATPase subunit